MARSALVLGAGGTAGVAFHSGVLAGLAEGLGWDPRGADLVVGTSAGSINGSALRAGVSAQDQLARACDEPLSAEGAALLAVVDSARPDDGTSEEELFTLPSRLPVGPPSSLGVLMAAGLRPWSVRPGAVLAGLMPAGTVATTGISSSIRLLCGDGWPQRPLWICSVSLHDGRLVVFGRDGHPRADVCDAVAASCAIPGYFSPVSIGGERYVDGGAHSLTNLTTVPSEDLDLVVVSAPMSRAGRPWRLRAARVGIAGVAREVARTQLALEMLAVRRRGLNVVSFSPTSRDRSAMGRNLMDPRRQSAVARQAKESTLKHLEREEIREQLASLQGVGA